jgi:hypothetical protein
VSKQGRGDSKDKEDARKLGSGNREDTREHRFLLSYHHHRFYPMSFPPVIDLQSFHRAKDESHLGTPGTEDTIKAAMAVIDNSTNDVVRGHRLGDGLDVIEAILRAAFVPQAVSPLLLPL